MTAAIAYPCNNAALTSVPCPYGKDAVGVITTKGMPAIEALKAGMHTCMKCGSEVLRANPQSLWVSFESMDLGTNGTTTHTEDTATMATTTIMINEPSNDVQPAVAQPTIVIPVTPAPAPASSDIVAHANAVLEQAYGPAPVAPVAPVAPLVEGTPEYDAALLAELKKQLLAVEQRTAEREATAKARAKVEETLATMQEFCATIRGGGETAYTALVDMLVSGKLGACVPADTKKATKKASSTPASTETPTRKSKYTQEQIDTAHSMCDEVTQGDIAVLVGLNNDKPGASAVWAMLHRNTPSFPCACSACEKKATA